MSEDEACDLVARWKISNRLADRAVNVLEEWFRETRINIEVISGFRTRAEQIALGRKGRPTAPFDVSTHTECPATGVDFRISGFVTDLMKARFGRIAVMNGLRWGGGGEIDPETGIPLDWNHVDLGPRRTG